MARRHSAATFLTSRSFYMLTVAASEAGCCRETLPPCFFRFSAPARRDEDRRILERQAPCPRMERQNRTPPRETPAGTPCLGQPLAVQGAGEPVSSVLTSSTQPSSIHPEVSSCLSVPPPPSHLPVPAPRKPLFSWLLSWGRVHMLVLLSFPRSWLFPHRHSAVHTHQWFSPSFPDGICAEAWIFLLIYPAVSPDSVA